MLGDLDFKVAYWVKQDRDVLVVRVFHKVSAFEVNSVDISIALDIGRQYGYAMRATLDNFTKHEVNLVSKLNFGEFELVPKLKRLLTRSLKAKEVTQVNGEWSFTDANTIYRLAETYPK